MDKLLYKISKTYYNGRKRSVSTVVIKLCQSLKAQQLLIYIFTSEVIKEAFRKR